MSKLQFPPEAGPFHLFRFSLDQASLRAGKVTVFCVRQRFARSSLRLSTCKSFWNFVRKASRGFCILPRG